MSGTQRSQGEGLQRAAGQTMSRRGRTVGAKAPAPNENPRAVSIPHLIFTSQPAAQLRPESRSALDDPKTSFHLPVSLLTPYIHTGRNQISQLRPHGDLLQGTEAIMTPHQPPPEHISVHLKDGGLLKSADGPVPGLLPPERPLPQAGLSEAQPGCQVCSSFTMDVILFLPGNVAFTVPPKETLPTTIKASGSVKGNLSLA